MQLLHTKAIFWTLIILQPSNYAEASISQHIITMSVADSTLKSKQTKNKSKLEDAKYFLKVINGISQK